MYLLWFTSSLSFDVLCLHVAENISLTYTKIFLLIVLVDSCLSHVMTSYTITKLLKGVHFFFSDFLLLEILDKRRGF
jgi:hypothetical protein